MNLFIVAITRAWDANEWLAIPAADIASGVSAPVALRSMSLMDLFTRAASAGADVAEFKSIWQYSEFVQRVEAALGDGNLAGAQGLLAVCPVNFSGATLAAFAGVLEANTLRLVDVVAAEQSQPGAVVTAPAKATPEDVTAALNEAGYRWNGDEWARQ